MTFKDLPGVRRAHVDRSAGRLLNVEVKVEGDRVHLCGCVTTYFAKQFALHAAIDVDGTELVANNLRVI